MPETGRHGMPKLPRRQPRWQRAVRWVGNFTWQGTLLVAGVLSAEAISAGTNSTGRLLLAVGAVFTIVAGGQIVLPILGTIVARIAHTLVTRWRWRRG